MSNTKKFGVRTDFYSEGPPVEKASKILDGAMERVEQEGIDKNEMLFHQNMGLSSEIEDDEEERKKHFMSFTFFNVQE